MTLDMTEPRADGPPLLLASASPRRRAMLAAAGLAVEVRPPHIPEWPRPGEAPQAYALRIAAEKATAAQTGSAGSRRAILAADTVVTVDGEILGKPGSTAEAESMLSRLSGRTHEVITAVAVAGATGGVRVASSSARVTFRPLSAAEVTAYVVSGEPMDKAGAYGIQGLAGAFVTDVEGTYDTVVGLPVKLALSLLADAGFAPAALEPFQARWAVLRARIAAACQAVGRDPEDITLVGVSKTQPVEALEAALAAGFTTFGENYVQEWVEKAERLGDRPSWHFIGHLQSNKARFLAPRVAAVHALDSLSAAAALDRAAERVPRVLDVCVQVNVAGERQKSGLAPDALGPFLAALEAHRHLRVQGLMTVPPDGPLCASRACFAALRRLRDAHARPDRPLRWLSMGMSGDFDQAIAEGATHVRVGTALFGARPAARMETGATSHG